MSIHCYCVTQAMAQQTPPRHGVIVRILVHPLLSASPFFFLFEKMVYNVPTRYEDWTTMRVARPTSCIRRPMTGKKISRNIVRYGW